MWPSSGAGSSGRSPVRVNLAGSRRLAYDDGRPVRAASGIARLGDGWLVVQDDGTHAAWWRGPSITELRIFPDVDGHDEFTSAAGTKHLKPDVESACEVVVDGRAGVLVLGSGSNERRMRGAVVVLADAGPEVRVADLDTLFRQAVGIVGPNLDALNFEAVCCLGEELRWFNRGNPSRGVPSSSVTLPTAALLAAIWSSDPLDCTLSGHRQHRLGEVAGVGLAVTDAVVLADGRMVVSAAAEDTPTMVDDGPVVASALALLAPDGELVAMAEIPRIDGAVAKVEGLALVSDERHRLGLVAVVDADDHHTPSLDLDLVVDLP